MKVPHVNGFLCSIFDSVLSNGRINYMVSEYRVEIGKHVSNVVFASKWAKDLVTFDKQPEIVEVVHHEVPANTMFVKPVNLPSDYAFFVSDVQPRKNPDLWYMTIKKLKFKVLAVTKPEWCAKLSQLPNFKCIGYFGQVPHETLNAYMARARLFLWMTGGEGFGLPPLEASWMGVFPVAQDIPPLNEWFPSDLRKYLVKPKFQTTAGSFLRGSPYVVFKYDPNEFAEVANQLFYDNLTEVRKALRDYVDENYTRGRKYERFYEIMGRIDAVEKKAKAKGVAK